MLNDHAHCVDAVVHAVTGGNRPHDKGSCSLLPVFDVRGVCKQSCVRRGRLRVLLHTIMTRIDTVACFFWVEIQWELQSRSSTN